MNTLRNTSINTILFFFLISSIISWENSSGRIIYYPHQKVTLFLTHLCIYLFIFGCSGSSFLRGLFSSFGELELLSVAVHRLLLLWGMGSRALGFRSCSMQAQKLWIIGLIAPLHVESSWLGIKPKSPALASRILSTSPTSQVQILTLSIPLFCSWHSMFPSVTIHSPSPFKNFL